MQLEAKFSASEPISFFDIDSIDHFEILKRQKIDTQDNRSQIILSDFLDANYDDALKVTAKKHDVIGIKVYDKMDLDLPEVGLLQVKDAETGQVKWVDTNNRNVRQDYHDEFFRITDYATNIFKKSGSDLLHLRTGDDYVKVLQRFFISRSR